MPWQVKCDLSCLFFSLVRVIVMVTEFKIKSKNSIFCDGWNTDFSSRWTVKPRYIWIICFVFSQHYWKLRFKFMQSSKYAAMVTPPKCNTESGGFREFVYFLGPWQYLLGRQVNWDKSFLWENFRYFWYLAEIGMVECQASISNICFWCSQF